MCQPYDLIHKHTNYCRMDGAELPLHKNTYTYIHSILLGSLPSLEG